MARMFYTLPELTEMVNFIVPGAKQTPWIIEALRELYDNGVPSPNPGEEGRRMPIPSQWAQFARQAGIYAAGNLNAKASN